TGSHAPLRRRSGRLHPARALARPRAGNGRGAGLVLRRLRTFDLVSAPARSRRARAAFRPLAMGWHAKTSRGRARQVAWAGPRDAAGTRSSRRAKVALLRRSALPPDRLVPRSTSGTAGALGTRHAGSASRPTVSR